MSDKSSFPFLKHSLIKAFLLCAFIFTSVGSFSQKNKRFTGMLEYKITIRDSAMQTLIPESRMIVFTNDTIVRTENNTGQLGQQVVLRHIEKNKSYLLLNTPLGKFAIQTDLNSSDTIQKISHFSFEKKCMKRKLLGKKMKRMMVSHPDFEEPQEFWYLPTISSKYNNAFTEMPGLPVKYSIPTRDGIMDYELVKISEFLPERDMFGVPSDYERISFDGFMDLMIKSQEVPIPDQE